MQKGRAADERACEKRHFAEERLRKYLMRRRQKRGPGYTQYPTRAIYDHFGLYRLPTRLPCRTEHA